MSATLTSPPAPASPTPSRTSLWGLRIGAWLLAAGAGVLLYASFPPRTLWWLALPAFALFGVLLRGAGPRRGFELGMLFGIGFLLPLLSWTGYFVGSLPWVALVVFESLFLGLAGAGMALVSRLRAGWSSALWPVWAAAVWVAAEAIRGRIPFGGLPWGRVGFGQPDAPTLPLAALGGVPLLSFVTVLAGLALGEVLRIAVRGLRTTSERPADGLATRSTRWAAVPAVLVALVLVAGPLAALVPPQAGPPERTVTVAAIQGNVPRLGLEFNAQRRAVLDNHVRQTERLAADVAAGRQPRPDIVIWPENSSDIDPLRNADAAVRIDAAAAAIRAPILVGAVLVNGDRTTSNAALIWEAGQGVVARTDKRRIQPFGEYMPWRSFFRLFSSYVDRAGNFVPGPGSGVAPMAGIAVGVAICWEVAFDDLVADSVDAGAQILAVPSNNATFGLTEMTFQQLAMSRVRAVEHDRPVVVATTSGVSAMIRPDGTVTASTGQFVPGVLVDRVPLKGTSTLAGRLRSVPEWTLTALGVLAVAFAVGTSRRRSARPGVGSSDAVGPNADGTAGRGGQGDVPQGRVAQGGVPQGGEDEHG
ncbi:apolipoprotein N-acyltransferase [Pseudonocardia sp. KRD291]|uniref:apolipoprotein N-acyltransferase n=1 Tax=Pseudonocardia sp. KRD291 TaxID=2792007 RepID=UPI001C49FD84|nr:apolipoprotein N-acyltransferase [Pseudonocardia sp. KRD291]MBW0101101.1 apolipoprotein N-acyltransferase [Pseudonocardia sp. KRD291]